MVQLKHAKFEKLLDKEDICCKDDF